MYARRQGGPGLGASLFALMGPQDTVCVEVLLELLKTHLLLGSPMPGMHLALGEWAPHVLFAQFLRHLSLDSSVLLDFLVDDTGPLVLEYCIRCGLHRCAPCIEVLLFILQSLAQISAVCKQRL